MFRIFCRNKNDKTQLQDNELIKIAKETITIAWRDRENQLTTFLSKKRDDQKITADEKRVAKEAFIELFDIYKETEWDRLEAILMQFAGVTRTYLNASPKEYAREYLAAIEKLKQKAEEIKASIGYTKDDNDDEAHLKTFKIGSQ